MIAKTKKLINSFKYAFTGIATSFKTERNMKIHVLIMILVIIAGIVFKVSLLDWIILVIMFGLVISAELFNTAIETTVDIAMPERNEKAKKAKDVAAGAVFVIAMASAVIGLLIFVPKIVGAINSLI